MVTSLGFNIRGYGFNIRGYGFNIRGYGFKTRGYTLKAKGFTLVEILVTIGLLVTLLGIATPSFAKIIDKSRVSAASAKITRSLALARSSALSHSKTVLVCQVAKSSPLECVKSHKRNENWELGWLIYVDENQNNGFDPSDVLLQTLQPNKNAAVVFNQTGRLRFFADGSARSAGFYVCTRDSNEVKHIKLLYSGRMRVVKNTTSKTLEVCKNTLR